MDTRCIKVQKDGLQFKIEIKPIGRYARNQRTSYVRGYKSSLLANRDIPRLKLHLKSKRAGTFEKHVPDEMEELLCNPSKRKCSRALIDTPIVPAVRVLKGQVFIHLRRKLSWKYHLYQKAAKNEAAPFLSRANWLLEQETVEVPNYAELENEAKGLIALAYIHQRLRVLRGRKVKNMALMDGLRECIFTGQMYTKIREVVYVEDSEVLDLTEAPAKYTQESTSKASMKRVVIQGFTVLSMLEQIELKNDKETLILKRLLSELQSRQSPSCSSDIMFKEHEVVKRHFRAENTMNILSDKVRQLARNAMSSRKIREWYNEYLENGSFEEDMRGCWKRDMFLEEYGYSLRFQIYLKNEKKLTVDIATKELESIIQKDPPKSEEGKRNFESLRPFSRRTVHRWMTKLGCKYEKATVSYYTDSHEAEETKKDMKER